ncbi:MULTISPECIES: DUF4126 domain-containing protein [unclassified Methylophaga]|jgi:hypothetical protein|uniref:DUF4126 domain-containing protein n=3 Tax=Methylophaga TaxID=40222 RepID=UPI000C943A57|nr:MULTISPECIES: DUF4126 domain-containing protein [unclassified Methylophaga]MAK67396.1 hypothetical protein [Methylophaga sp.]MAY16936.1 hypothetical protein [Methylophaga sp.]MBN46549.1 hypothetical protein [Methylophaga sp.]HAO24249.1 DUF4126 domain-containing protein [Methylophaga sp.]|tara:strand:+ start:73840 stop:74514 length:675 start_codon:yes stop_codon:yes gene_type:complete
MDAVSIIALSMGAAWASGINLYAAVFMLGYMGSTGHIVLPDELQVLSDPLVMTAAAVMYCVEFFADKVPGVDTGWDTLHTFIRIPAGAMLAASAVGDVSPAIELTAGLLGGSLAAATHATKAGSRLLINTSPEPFSNWGASVTEDLLVIAGLWTALTYPIWFLAALVIFIVLMIWLLPRLWRLIRTVLQYIGSWLGWCEKPETSSTAKTAEPTMVKSVTDKTES